MKVQVPRSSQSSCGLYLPQHFQMATCLSALSSSTSCLPLSEWSPSGQRCPQPLGRYRQSRPTLLFPSEQRHRLVALLPPTTCPFPRKAGSLHSAHSLSSGWPVWVQGAESEQPRPALPGWECLTTEPLLQPSSERPSLSALLLELGPQAIYINMFVTDMKIETFFGLIKMFKLELACCLWISPFC